MEARQIPPVAMYVIIKINNAGPLAVVGGPKSRFHEQGN